ncbi:MAG: hypothetical protein E4H01_08325 [Lysobacterales bacterium]|nr:MAG: hypothetical protein E4H01_08325 [Xanthomonadales bacterium]
MSEVKATLKCKLKKHVSIFEVTDSHFVEKWTKGIESGEKKVLLSKLSPDLSRTTARSGSLTVQLIGGVIFLVLTAIFFFSPIQSKIPFLSVFFLALSLWSLFRSFGNVKPKSWTIILNENGERIAWFINDDCNPEEREKFEAELISSIKKQKEKATNN